MDLLFPPMSENVNNHRLTDCNQYCLVFGQNEHYQEILFKNVKETADEKYIWTIRSADQLKVKARLVSMVI